jgi:hypothetical protein
MSSARAIVSGIFVLAVLLTGGTFLGDLGPTVQAEEILGGPLRYQVKASGARLNRKVMGPVTHYVHGVPAEPVNSFVWDGDGSVPVRGQLILEIDPVGDSGFIQARWEDENGSWVYTQYEFIHPEHPSGVRLGATASEVITLINEGVTDNVYLHGDTGAGQPILPTVFTHLATWGPVEIERNGEPFDNPYEIPAPKWLGHLMVTEGVRWPDGSVRLQSGEIYHPSRAIEGAVEQGDLEVHLVFHDEHFPMTTNLPPIYSFFYHLVFEDVQIKIIESTEPIVIDEPDPQPQLTTKPASNGLRKPGAFR